ncbi:MAG: carboxypeptidase regulatory-like domain-containing protein, partial [Polyangia bacterium]
RVQRDYALSPEATVVGRVVRADPNAPVAGASVRVTSIDRMFQRFAAPGAAASDAQGRFTIGGQAAGRQRVVAFAEGLASSEAIDINVEAGKPTGEILLRLRPAARLAGVVTDGHDPIVGATVSLGMGGVGFDGVTQADGSFVVDPVARGRTVVFVRDYDVKEPKTLVIDRASMTGVRVLVASLGSVAGRVTMGGKPLAGARVNCGRTETAYADADGNYIVRGLTADKYHVFADSPAEGAFGEVQDFVLKKGEQKTGVDVAIKYSASISGTVVDSDGKPVGNVMVNYDAPKIQDSGQDVTAPDGTFHAAFMKGGAEYKPTVHVGMRNFSKLRVVDGDAPVDVKDGSTAVTGVRIVVQRDHLSIAGTTVDGDGQPLGDVHINAFRADGDNSAVFNQWVDHPSTTSSGDGRFAIDDLDAGSFVLQARAGDGSEAIVRGVSAGQKTVVIKLARAGGIDGTLVGFTSPPSVRAQRQLPGAFMPAVFATVDGNAFHFSGLNPGTYQIAASGSDSDAAMVDVAPGQIATVTLKSRGSARIHGHVVEWSSGTPVGGFQCVTGLRTSPAMPMWTGDSTAISDDNGTFEMDDAPAGAIAVQCVGTG